MSTTQNNERRDLVLTIITGVIAVAVIIFAIALSPYMFVV
jgi:hypothetical protein